jgi:uncharacterized protein YbbK (DUF523 family)
MLDKILISACFLGAKVRYNGEIKPLADLLVAQWREEGRLIAVCPEVEGGLSVPRAPAELNKKTRKVINNVHVDVTKEFTKGALKALALCTKYNIQFALLKESSPSCGSSLIYDGSFSENKISGEGITTSLLRKNNIQVFSENNIQQLAELLDNINKSASLSHDKSA